MTPFDMGFKVQFDSTPNTHNVHLESASTPLAVDFGNAQQITVGNVSIRLEETDEGVIITAWDAQGEKTAFVGNGQDGSPGERGETGPAGPQGERGLQGIQGVPGERGPQGAQGPAGKDGQPGERGPAGAPGQPGADGKTPVKGVDYYTSADKAEMVTAVLAALPVYAGEVADV